MTREQVYGRRPVREALRGRRQVLELWATERAVAGIPDTNGLSLTGTPMVLVNGKQYIGDLSDPAEFSQFVLTTASDAYYKSAPTPTPTPTEAPAS